MLRITFITLFVFLLSGRPAFAADNEPVVNTQSPVATPAAKPAAELSLGDAVVLGVVEGVTEYLPISSTGHLIIANKLLGLEGETPLVDAQGQPLWYKKPSEKHPEGVPLTSKIAADTFTVIIQFGAIAAVAFLYWKQIQKMLRGLLGRDPSGLLMVRNLLIAFVPAAALGYLLHDWIDSLFSVAAVLTAQVSGAILMILAENWRKKQSKVRTDRDPSELSGPEALGIGVLQCLALWPGMSRSMTTIVGGYFAGLNPRRAAEFSFLLGLVTLTAASVYKGLKSGAAMLTVFGLPSILVGCVVAALTAIVAVRFLVNYLSSHGLIAFAVYRFILAGALGVLLYVGYV